MARPQEKTTIMDNKKQDLNEITDDCRVDIGDKMDDNSDKNKSKIMLHDDHVASAKTAENETTSEPKIVTRYVNVPEAMVRFVGGEDTVLDLQIASGAMIQVTKPSDEDANAEFRSVRVIGLVENIDKAEKLIKAIIALVDVRGSGLLFKDYEDSDDYGTKFETFLIWSETFSFS